MSVSIADLEPLLCRGTRPHPGCGKLFYGNSRKLKFCPECAALDRQSSFVFVERKRARRALEEASE